MTEKTQKLLDNIKEVLCNPALSSYARTDALKDLETLGKVIENAEDNSKASLSEIQAFLKTKKVYVMRILDDGERFITSVDLQTCKKVEKSKDCDFYKGRYSSWLSLTLEEPVDYCKAHGFKYTVDPELEGSK